jgi:hypothetical protein
LIDNDDELNLMGDEDDRIAGEENILNNHLECVKEEA